MRAHLLTLLLPLLLAGCAAHLATRPAADAGSAPVRLAPIRPERERLLGSLATDLHKAYPDQRIPLLVEMRAQLDLTALAARMDAEGLGRWERREAVARAANEISRRGAAELEPFLERLESQGRIDEWQRFTIANRYWVVATPAGVRRLARRRDVDSIRWTEDQPRTREVKTSLPRWMGLNGDGAPDPPPLAGEAGDPHAWGPGAIGAPELWARGWTGAGIVVADLDTGADPTHEQLLGGFRGGDSSWFDPLHAGERAPHDPSGHGTGVLAAAIGRNPGGRPIGVAPGASWVAATVMREGKAHPAAVLAAADWVLGEAQPDVVVNPWTVEKGFGCQEDWGRVLSTWRLAEILPVLSAGNAGPGEGSNNSPANAVDLQPDGGRAFSVGAARRTGSVAAISGRGPNRCDGGTFPSVCAPGYLLRIAEPKAPGGYRVGWGSSFAAGQAGGAAALLMQAFPEARVIRIEEALRETARDTGPPGTDNECGHGTIDLPAAAEWLEARRESREGSRR